MSKRPLIFVGSRYMLVDLAVIAELNNIEIVGILDHHYWKQQEFIADIPVIGDERWLLDPDNAQVQQWKRTCDFFPANWDSGRQDGVARRLRLERINLLDQIGVNVINLIHPSATIPPTNSKYSRYSIGRGVLLEAGCYHSADYVKIGDYCTFSANTACNTHSRIDRNVTFGPLVVTTHCHIKQNTVMGMYSRTNYNNKKTDLTLTGLTIGENSSIWMSAEVDKDIPDNSMFTHTGRILKKSENFHN